MKVFLNLFQYGVQSLQAITNMVAFPRSTVQSIVHRLLDEGLILLSQQGMYPSYSALSFDQLLQYLTHRSQQFITFQQQLLVHKQDFSQFQSLASKTPVVTYCMGKDIERLMYDKILSANYCDAVRDMRITMQYFHIDETKILDYARLARKKTRRIVIDCPIARIYQKTASSDVYEIKLMSQSQGNYSDYMLINNVVYHVSYENPLQPLGMIIQDHAYYKFQSAMFDALWEKLE